MTSGPTYRYSYTWSPAQPTRGALSTSRQEILQISVAFLVLTFDFVLILYVGGIFSGQGLASLTSVPLWLVVVALTTALTAFVAHELAHKISAQRHGYWAEFRWSPMGLVFSVVTAYLGFLFAAPGATVVGGMGDPRDWARTSLAGPMTNAGFSAIFYAGSLAAVSVGNAFAPWLLFLAWINGWFGAFNLIPFGPLDGAKILRVSVPMWAAAMAVTVALAALGVLGLYGYWLPPV
jgi:Zn-dependent protease